MPFAALGLPGQPTIYRNPRPLFLRSALYLYNRTTVQPPTLTAEKLMGKLEDASTKAIDAKPFTAVAPPGCARVFLPAPVTARHDVSGESSRPAGATTRGYGSTRRNRPMPGGLPNGRDKDRP